MKTINICSSKHNYQVIINENLDTLIKSYLDKNSKYFVILDKKLKNKKRYFKQVSSNFVFVEIEAGEKAKSLKTYEKIIKKLLEHNFSKKDTLIAFGGGSIGDLVGYIASTYKRGTQFINIPTTTLSMIDSSIGGKNALNINNIKNAIGTIYPPKLVLCGFDILNSLDERNFNNGLFEALKIGILANKNIYDFFLYNKFKENIYTIIEESIKEKAKIVEKDEYDKNIRKVLNFGHTIGHAIELNYNLLHGEAIALGMFQMTKKYTYFDEFKTILNHLKLDTSFVINKDLIISSLINDKKYNSNKIELIEVEKLQCPIIKTISTDELLRRIL